MCIFCRFVGSQPKSFPFQFSPPAPTSLFCNSVNWRCGACLPFNMFMVTPKAFCKVLHCSCLCSSTANPLMQKQLRSILAGTHHLRLLRSQRKSSMPRYPVLTACLVFICITFWKNLPFSWDKVTLVCGSDGRAAQMDFLVTITEGAGVPGAPAWSLTTAWWQLRELGDFCTHFLGKKGAVTGLCS